MEEAPWRKGMLQQEGLSDSPAPIKHGHRGSRALQQVPERLLLALTINQCR